LFLSFVFQIIIKQSASQLKQAATEASSLQKKQNAKGREVEQITSAMVSAKSEAGRYRREAERLKTVCDDLRVDLKVILSLCITYL